MSSHASHALKRDGKERILFSDITHVRENRMPVQIAEVRATGYIPQQFKKSSGSLQVRTVRESQQENKIPSILKNMDEFSLKKQADGETFRGWRRTDNAEHSWPRKVITNG